MFGNYILHHPLTDFAVALLVIAALIDVGRLVLRRPQWQAAVDLLLLLGFGGALVSVGSGLWLVAVQDHGHSKTLTIHHWLAYSTLGVATVGVIAHFLAGRRPAFAKLKTAALLVSAALVSSAGFHGGKMAHPAGEAMPHTHGDEPAPHDAMPRSGSGSAGSGTTATPAAESSTVPAKPHVHEHQH